MVGLEGSGEKLGTEEGQVRFNWYDLGFGVKMANGGHLHITGGCSEGGVLDGLNSIEGAGGCIGEPDWSAVGEE